jgi:glycosyltransferase involved in cell wall biosynthesis
MLVQLKQQATSIGGGDAVLFVGYVDAVGDLFDTVDIVVNCSSTEAIPRVLLESGAAGVPVVATAVGGIPEIVEDGATGILCQPGDAEAIQRAVASLVGDAALRQRLGTAARDRVTTTYSVEVCSRRLIGVYESLRGAQVNAVNSSRSPSLPRGSSNAS